MRTFIDFRTASVTWLTNSGSYGRFMIDAVLQMNNDVYYLGNSVMACNMYVREQIIQTPPYLYQAAFSDTHYRIFRSAPGTETLDSAGLHDERFQRITVRDCALPVAEVSEPSVKAELLAGTYLVAQVEWRAGSENDISRLRFPVRHINFSDAFSMFQVETGPVLFPVADEGGAQFALGYLAFNSLSKMEVILRRRSTGSTFYEEVVVCNCNTNLFKYKQ